MKPAFYLDYLRKEYNDLTAINDHGEAALILVKAFGTKDDKGMIEGLNWLHRIRGHQTHAEIVRRDAIANKYYTLLFPGKELIKSQGID